MQHAHAGFPVVVPALRRVHAQNLICPECGYNVTAGWECLNCGQDIRLELQRPIKTHEQCGIKYPARS